MTSEAGSITGSVKGDSTTKDGTSEADNSLEEFDIRPVPQARMMAKSRMISSCFWANHPGRAG